VTVTAPQPLDVTVTAPPPLTVGVQSGIPGPPGPPGPAGAPGAPVALPPPATGTTLQAYVDETGEQWIARGDISAGAWKRGRDVLHAYWYRTAAFTVAASKSILAMDTKAKDDYGLYDGAGNFTAPVSGWYGFTVSIGAASPAAGTAVFGVVSQSGAPDRLTALALAGGAGNVSVPATGRQYLAAGTRLITKCYASVALTGTPGLDRTYFDVSYLGTG
jgi:hypothetical protein